MAPQFTRRDIAMLGSVVAVGIATPWGLAALRLPGDPVEPSPVLRAVLDDPSTPVIGAAGGDVTIVEFTDYRCPVCRRSGAALAAVMADDPAIRVLVKEWPALGPESVPPARAALAAHRLGQFAAAHEALRQAGPVDAAGIAAALAGAGLDPAKVAAVEARDGAVIDRILAGNAHQAWSLGLQGVPAFLVGNRLVRGGVGERDLRRLVAIARA